MNHAHEQPSPEVRLVPARLPIVEAALAGDEALANAVGCEVAPGWATFAGALEATRDALVADPESVQWGPRLFIGDDPPKVVQSLPGVARSTLGSGEIVVWGADPAIRRDVAATRAVLDAAAIDTAGPCGGDAADNNTWGQGRLDAYAAVQLVARPIAGTGRAERR